MKKADAEHSKFTKACMPPAARFAELSSQLETLKGIAGGAGGAFGGFGLGLGIVAAGVTAFGATVVDAGIKLGKFVVQGANDSRSMNLMREAAAGSAENAKNLGTWVDYLSTKVSTSKAKINQMAIVLEHKLSGGLSKASGTTIVTTLDAMVKAADAAGPEMGAKIQEVIERGRMLNRLSLSPQDMDQLPLRFQDVAEALAKNMHVGIEGAKASLATGGVSLEAGATAIRDAVEKKFGPINAAKMLDVGTQFDKAFERLQGLTKNVALEPLLKGMSRVFDQFDAGTATGKKLQGTFTKIGDAIGTFAEKHAGDFVEGIGKLVDVGGRAIDMFIEWEPKIESAATALANNKAVVTGLKAAIGGAGIIIEQIERGLPCRRQGDRHRFGGRLEGGRSLRRAEGRRQGHHRRHHRRIEGRRRNRARRDDWRRE